MKSVVLFFILATSILHAQIDNNGNPIFNSVTISQDTLDNFILVTNYYTISNNIDNPNSSVFVSSEPSNDEIIDFVRTLPSYFFLIENEQEVQNMIMVLTELDGKKSKYSFNILNPRTEEQIQIDCQTLGDMTAVRALELLKLYPNESKELKMGSNSLVVFNKIAYSIQNFDKLKNEIIELIQKNELYKKDIFLESIKKD